MPVDMNCVCTFPACTQAVWAEDDPGTAGGSGEEGHRGAEGVYSVLG
eukprot:SAG22_NODE_9996_length_559_cov_1.004348_2_plen_46_part_01